MLDKDRLEVLEDLLGTDRDGDSHAMYDVLSALRGPDIYISRDFRDQVAKVCGLSFDLSHDWLKECTTSIIRWKAAGKNFYRIKNYVLVNKDSEEFAAIRRASGCELLR